MVSEVDDSYSTRYTLKYPHDSDNTQLCSYATVSISKEDAERDLIKLVTSDRLISWFFG